MVVYKIPYSSCIFNRAVVLEPGTIVCAYHTAVYYLVPRSCLWYLSKVCPDVVDIGSGYFVVYFVFVMRTYMFGWLCRATYCSVGSTSMLGVSHAVQNEKKLWKSRANFFFGTYQLETRFARINNAENRIDTETKLLRCERDFCTSPHKSPNVHAVFGKPSNFARV